MNYDAILINTLYKLEIQKRYRGVQYIISCIDHIENKKEFLTYHKNFVCG